MNFRLLFSLIIACATFSQTYAVSYHTPQELRELSKQKEYKKTSIVEERIKAAIKIAIALIIIHQLYNIDWKTVLKNFPRSMKDLANLHLFKLSHVSCEVTKNKMIEFKFVEPLL